MNVHGLILPSRIVGMLIMLVAVFPAGLGIYLYVSTATFLDKATPTQGTVVEVRPSRGGEGTAYRTIFEYQDQSGTIHRKVSRCSSNPPTHAVGETVEVFFVPGDPANARIAGFLSLWFGPVVCAALTIVPVVVSLMFLWLIPFTIRRVWPTPRARAKATS